jgi:hypothetical protein
MPEINFTPPPHQFQLFPSPCPPYSNIFMFTKNFTPFPNKKVFLAKFLKEGNTKFFSL